MQEDKSVKMSFDEKHYEEGIIREKKGDEFIYYYVNTGKVVKKEDIERINKLRIPPAWTDVWISRDPDSAIQVIGRDAKGRKQYRYNQMHIEQADKEKFFRMIDFINSLPKLEKILAKHSELPFYDKNRVVSLMLLLVQEYHMRVGKEVYARQNRSYGISSMRKKHVKIGKNIIHLKFKGKSNQRLHYTITNPEFINDIKMMMKLEGDRLFQYITVDERGTERIYPVTDKDLNAYIQQYMGEDFTIKDFRTYAANETFVKSLLNETKKRSPKDRRTIKKNIMNAFKSTARQLKHTGAVSKKSYVLNFALELYQNDPEIYIKNKNIDPTDFLKMLLDMYKSNVMNE